MKKTQGFMMRYLRSLTALSLCALLTTGTALAVDIAATGANQVDPATWNSATWTSGGWSDSSAPSVGKTYTTAGVQIRTSTAATTFGGASLRVASGGSLVLNLLTTRTATIGSLILDGGTLISGGSGTASTQNISGNTDVNANSTIELNGTTGNHRISLTSGGLSGNGKITIQGGNDANDYFFVNTASASTHTGNWDINAGRLIVIADDQIGNSARVTLGSDTTAFLELRTVANHTIGSLSGNGTVQVNNGTRTLTTGGDGTSTTFDGVITTGLALTKEGAGTFTLSSGLHTFAGAININGGTLEFSGVNAGLNIFGSTEININGASTLKVSGTTSNVRLFDGRNYTFNSVGGGKIELGAGGNYDAGVAAQPFSITTQGGAQNTIKTINDGISGANGFNLGGSAATFDVTLGSDATSDLVVTPIIANNGSVVKTGTGRLTLAGANTYAGTTAVNGGTLLVNSSHVAAGAYTVSSGATLGGSGTIGSAVTVSNNGTLAPGTNSVAGGVLTCAGGLTLAAGVTNAFDCTASACDRVAVTGALTLQGANTVALTLSGATVPKEVTLFTFTSVTGDEYLTSWTVTGLPSGYKSKVLKVNNSIVVVNIQGTLIRVL